MLDFGTPGVGDPAVDLHDAWEVLDAPARDAFCARLGVADEGSRRGCAWAMSIAHSALACYGETMPHRHADRLAMARSIPAAADAGYA